MGRYCFSGHESFQCKPLWLKKGYDFLTTGNRFTDVDAVVKLGVGKNMVSAIRFWLRATGLTANDLPTDIAVNIFDNQSGKDPFIEDLNTVWLLHYLLVATDGASLYRLLFLEFQREKREFTRADLQSFVKRKCAVPEQKNVYNENTVRKDIGVLLKNYAVAADSKSIEDYAALFIGLNLIVGWGNDAYAFREVKPSDVAPEIVLYSLIRIKGDDKTVSFDKLQQIALTFCMPMIALIDVIRVLERKYPNTIVFTDVSGIKNVQFLCDVDEAVALNSYYDLL